MEGVGAMEGVEAVEGVGATKGAVEEVGGRIVNEEVVAEAPVDEELQ